MNTKLYTEEGTGIKLMDVFICDKQELIIYFF